MESLETLLALLRQNDLKITPQRRVILELLIEDDSHPTADGIYQRVLAVMPDVSRTTVYNTLRELVHLGVLAEVQEVSGDGLRYDTRTGPHHHLFCTRCHTLIDIIRDFEGIILSPEETAGYRIMKHQVTFYGLCPECQKREIN
ncbi:MAG: transcriptional repressor [Anaerolineae bacterium]|nr:transcriptional repressor [Anaerolineae bacterium]